MNFILTFPLVHKPYKSLWKAIILASCFAWSGDQARSQTPGNIHLGAEIDRLTDAAIKDGEIPGGYVVGVIVDGELSFTKAYGKSDAGTAAAMQVDAVFPIASVSKTFVGVLAVKLAAQETVDLDAPVTRYLPADVRFHPSVTNAAISLETLLTHRVGWPKDQSTRVNLPLPLKSGFDLSIPDPSSYTRRLFYKGLFETPTETAEGRHSYSNMGVLLAGHILELAGNKSYAELINEQIFAPLEMRETYFERPNAIESRVPTGYAYDEVSGEHVKVPAWTPGEIASSHGISSTVQDLGRYLEIMIDQRAASNFLGGRQWDSKLFQPYVRYVRTPETLYEQGLGWRMSTFGEYGRFYRHNGDADGHHAFVAFSRCQKVGVIVLTNSSHDTMEELGNQILLAVMEHVKANMAAKKRADVRSCLRSVN
jgi:CubicO group peptidase (beta-lactamase class C family)